MSIDTFKYNVVNGRNQLNAIIKLIKECSEKSRDDRAKRFELGSLLGNIHEAELAKYNSLSWFKKLSVDKPKVIGTYDYIDSNYGFKLYSYAGVYNVYESNSLSRFIFAMNKVDQLINTKGVVSAEFKEPDIKYDGNYIWIPFYCLPHIHDTSWAIKAKSGLDNNIRVLDEAIKDLRS